MERVTVVGAGPGGLAIAADLAANGRPTTVVDLEPFRSRLEPIRDRGIRIQSGWSGAHDVLVTVGASITDAVAESDLVVVSVRAEGHAQAVNAVVPALQQSCALLFMGEGSGSLVARRALLEHGLDGVLVGETNALPFISRSPEPGVVTVDRKSGGTLLSALPSARADELRSHVADVWPHIEATDSVWVTSLLNFDAIDTVPVAITNVGMIGRGRGNVLLWGDGLTEASANLIEGIDAELTALRSALGSTERRGYRDFLVAQGLAPDGNDLYSTMSAGGIMRSVRRAGDPDALRELLERDVACSFVLARSLGEVLAVPTPLISSVIAISERLVGHDFTGTGRTLQSLGLDGLDADGLRRYAAGGLAFSTPRQAPG